VNQYGYGGLDHSLTAIRQLRGDVNLVALESMDQGERDAFLETLFGTAMFERDAQSQESTPNLDKLGCVGEAVLETGGQQYTDALTGIAGSYADALDRLSAESEVAEAVSQWSACMAARGWSVANQVDAQQQIGQAYGEALETVASGPARDLSVEEALANTSVAEVHARELRMALDDHECFEEHAADIIEPKRYEIEQQLLDDNRDGLLSN